MKDMMICLDYIINGPNWNTPKLKPNHWQESSKKDEKQQVHSTFVHTNVKLSNHFMPLLFRHCSSCPRPIGARFRLVVGRKSLLSSRRWSKEPLRWVKVREPSSCSWIFFLDCTPGNWYTGSCHSLYVHPSVTGPWKNKLD